jgi:hypothetical protein
MAINLGALAGGLAKGGMETYSALTDIEAKTQETKRREAEFGAWQKEQAGKEALRAAIAEQGDVGSTTPAQTMAGPAPQGLPQEGGYGIAAVTPQDKLARIQQQALASGADPTAVMQYKQAARQDISAEQAQKAFQWMQGVDKAVTDKGLVAAVKEHLLPHYNSNKGTLNDGQTGQVETDKTGSFVVFKDANGKIVDRQPINQETFEAAKNRVGASMLAQSGPEMWFKAKETAIKERQVGVQESELAAKVKADLFGAQAKQALGAASASNAHAAVYNNMLTLAKENKAAGEAMKQYIEQFAALTPEEQQSSKGISILTAGAAAAAKKTGDVTGIISALKKPDADTKLTVNPDGTVTKGGALYVPDPNKPGAYKPAEGLGQSALDKAIAATKQ